MTCSNHERNNVSLDGDGGEMTPDDSHNRKDTNCVASGSMNSNEIEKLEEPLFIAMAWVTTGVSVNAADNSCIFFLKTRIDE